MNTLLSKRVFSFYLALGYTLAIFFSLYFTPSLAAYLAKQILLESFVASSYLSLAILIIALFFYRYRISHFKAYIFFYLLSVLFLLEYFNTPLLVERVHYLEYALLYALWFRVFRYRYRFNGVILCGITLWFVAFLGLLDEWVQHLLPNRHFSWSDVYLNIVGALFGTAAVSILMRYRRDKGELEAR